MQIAVNKILQGQVLVVFWLEAASYFKNPEYTGASAIGESAGF